MAGPPHRCPAFVPQTPLNKSSNGLCISPAKGSFHFTNAIEPPYVIRFDITRDGDKRLFHCNKSAPKASRWLCYRLTEYRILGNPATGSVRSAFRAVNH